MKNNKDNEIKEVFVSYTKAFLKGSLFIPFLYIAMLNKDVNILNQKDLSVCLSFICNYVSTTGNLGWKIQSWSGKSSTEKWNNYLSNMFFYLGLLTAILSL